MTSKFFESQEVRLSFKTRNPQCVVQEILDSGSIDSKSSSLETKLSVFALGSWDHETITALRYT